MIRRDLGTALTGWRVDIDSNNLRWPAASSRPDAYVVAEGGAVCTVHACENPRRALAAGADVPDTRGNALAADIRDARAYLLAAAPKLRGALEAMLAAYAPGAEATAKREGETALHPAVQAARAALALAGGGK